MRSTLLLALSVIACVPCQGAELRNPEQEASVVVAQSSVVGSMGESFSSLETLIFSRCFADKPFSDRLQLLELAVFQDSPPSTMADLPLRFAFLKKTVSAADSATLVVIKERAQRFFDPPEPAKATGIKRVGKVAGAAYLLFRLAASRSYNFGDTYGDIMSGDLDRAYGSGLLGANPSKLGH